MKVFVAWSVDHLDGMTAAALMSDNVVELRRISADLRRASENIKSWAMAVGGAPVLDLNTSGVVTVPADRMTELPGIVQKFKDLSDGTVSVGVGMSLSEAYVAMRHCAQEGGDRIVLYDPEMEDHHGHQQAPTSTEDAIRALGKADQDNVQEAEEPVGYADNPSDFGMADPSQSASSSASAAPQNSPAPAASASAGAPADVGQDPNGGQMPQQEGGQQEEQDPRTVIVQALQKIKSQAAVLEQMKQTNPEAFDAVKSVVAAMILMAQGMAAEADDSGGDDGGDGGSEEVAKSEDLVKMAIANFQPGREVGQNTYDYSHVLTPEQRAHGYTVQVKHEEKPHGGVHVTAFLHHPQAKGSSVQPKGQAGYVFGSIMPSQEDPKRKTLYISMSELDHEKHRGQFLGGHLYEAAMRHALMLGASHVGGKSNISTSASKTHQKLSQLHGMDYKARPLDPHDPRPPEDHDGRYREYEYAIKSELVAEAMEKAGLPMPETTPRRFKHDWPIGTQKEGSVKIQHIDPATNQPQGTGWSQMRAGMVMSPDGHPTSSRNPNGK